MAAPTPPLSVIAGFYDGYNSTIDWDANGQTVATISGIRIERWDNVSNTFSPLQFINSASLGYVPASTGESAVTLDRKIQYRVRFENADGASAWVVSNFFYTRPTAPSQVTGRLTGLTTLRAEWRNNHSASGLQVKVTLTRNDVNYAGPFYLSGTATSYDFGITSTGTYKVYVNVVTPNTDYQGGNEFGSLSGISGNVGSATAPNAPTNLSPSGGAVRDLTTVIPLTWKHSPSVDNSYQTKFQIRHRALGAGTWVTASVVTSATEGANAPWSTSLYANGTTVEWQVSTFGVHATQSPWSATATILGSKAPTVTLNTPTTTHPTSGITVTWTYADLEGTPQTAYLIKLYDADENLLETVNGTGTGTSYTLATVAENDTDYGIDISVRDTSGLWSAVVHRDFTVEFVPPAASALTITVDENSGASVLALTATADDGGLTMLPATSVTVERRMWDEEIEDFGPYELVAADLPPTATVIDPVGPIYGDGEYRVTTYSAAPSSIRIGTDILEAYETKWAYLSGGDNFSTVCRFWANIELTWTASRTKALHYFAGRERPVLYSGEASERTMNVTALITQEGTNPQKFLALAQKEGPVAFRAPGNRRIFGSLTGMSLERIHKGLHKVSFSIQEVYR